jgi:hypothetical protein
LKDGPNAGSLTRIYGGRWDRRANLGAGEYVGYYDPSQGVVGEECEKIHTAWISQQSLDFITDFEHKVILALGGRRSGKTAALACKCIILSLVFPGKQGAILSPTYRQAKNVWRHILRIVPRTWLKPGTHGIRKTEHRLSFVNGASIVLISADKEDGSRSEGSAWWGFDERQIISEDAAASAFLSTSEGEGNYIIAETATIAPKLRDHYDIVMANPKGHVYRMVSDGNPFIDHGFLEDAKSFLDIQTIKQELYAEWPELVGRVYYPFKDEHIAQYPLPFHEDTTTAECHDRFDTPSDGPMCAKYFISIDPPWHAVVWKLYKDGTMHAIDEVVVGADGKDGDVRDLVAMIGQRYTPGVCVYDPHESSYHHELRKYLKRYHLRLTGLRRIPIEYRCVAVRSRLEKGKFFVDPKCRFLIEALQIQTYVNNKPDKKCYSKIIPQMTVDHIADAAGYGIYRLYPAKYDYEKKEEKAA